MGIKRNSTLLAISVAAMFSACALAHGDEHGERATDKAVTPEQKAFGVAGDPTGASRTIEMDMTDEMRFVPATIEVKVGETIRFRLTNKGNTLHEMVIGTQADLQEHAALMRKFPEMEHSEPYMAHVKPGATEEIVWTFNRPGEFNYACLVAGHFEAGMVGKAIVKAGA